MARAAGELADAGKIHKIRNIVWAQPIMVEKQPQEVHISLYAEESRVDYAVSLPGADGQSVICSQGKLFYESHDSTLTEPEGIDVNAVKQRCATTKSRSECYTFFETLGFQYGPGFQPIEELCFNETEALSRLNLPAHLRNTFDEFGLHPNLNGRGFTDRHGISAKR